MKYLLIFYYLSIFFFNVNSLTIKYYNDSNCIALQKIETVKLNYCETIEEQGTLLSVIATVCNSTNVLGHVFDDPICNGNIFLNFSHTPKTCFYAGNIYYQYIDCETTQIIISTQSNSNYIHTNTFFILLFFIFTSFL